MMANTRFLNRRKALRLVILYLGIFAGFMACEDDIEPTVSDPSVSIFFLNQDSLNKVSIIIDSLDDELADYDSIISSLEDSADLLVDSLIVLTDSIANGGDLKMDSAIVVHDLDTLNTYLTGVEKKDSTVNATRKGWAATSTTINSGSVKIFSIENLKNGQAVFYEDSSTTWKMPLDMQADDIDVDITIDDIIYNLKLSYSRTTTADEKNKVVIKTSDFSIISTDFNNPSLSCQDCDNSNTTIYVEF